LILFARHPEAGRVKTRLIPALGAEGAAALHRRFVLRTLRAAGAACRTAQAELEIRFDGGSEAAMSHWLGEGRFLRKQPEGDLGRRMECAFKDSFQEGSTATIIIGSDCPELTAELLRTAFERLTTEPVVFGPTNDGGYYLIGLSQPVPELFHGISWGTDTVLPESLRALARSRLEAVLLKRLNDIDRPEDLSAWRRITEAEDTGVNRLSVIIPALNEVKSIATTLAAVREGRPHEIFLVDGAGAPGK